MAKKFHETKLGKFLHEKAPNILDTVGGFLPDAGALGIVKNLISKDDAISVNDRATAFQLIDAELKELELTLKDKENARTLQVEALRQEDVFSKRFIYYLALFWSVIASLYFFLATFTEAINEHFADTILGFMLGTIVAKILSFFYGSSQGSKDKAKQLNQLK